MNKNLLLGILLFILFTAFGTAAYFYYKNSSPIQNNSQVADTEKVIKMDDIYVDQNEKVVKPQAEVSSTKLDESQIESQVNELDNLDTQEVSVDELN